LALDRAESVYAATQARRHGRSYSYSTTAAMAAAISSRWSADRPPSFLVKRIRSALLICKASAADTWSRPFSAVASMRTNHGVCENLSCQVVKGTTTFIGKIPTASELITTARLHFAISDPNEGLKSTIQTSPRLGATALVVKDFPSLQ